MFGRGLLKIFLYNSCQNIYNEITTNVNFHIKQQPKKEMPLLKRLTFSTFLQSSRLWLLRRWSPHLANLAFLLPWQPIKFSSFDKIHIFVTWLLQEHFCEMFWQNICSEIAIKANFNFSNYKSMETISCNRNQSSYPIGKKKKKNGSSPPPSIFEIW